MTRCITCGDPCPHAWRFCVTCHRWHDLATALEFSATLGIDEFRLKRALEHLVPRRRRGLATKASIRTAIRELIQRVEYLEARA